MLWPGHAQGPQAETHCPTPRRVCPRQVTLLPHRQARCPSPSCFPAAEPAGCTQRVAGRGMRDFSAAHSSTAQGPPAQPRDSTWSRSSAHPRHDAAHAVISVCNPEGCGTTTERGHSWRESQDTLGVAGLRCESHTWTPPPPSGCLVASPVSAQGLGLQGPWEHVSGWPRKETVGEGGQDLVSQRGQLMFSVRRDGEARRATGRHEAAS